MQENGVKNLCTLETDIEEMSKHHSKAIVDADFVGCMRYINAFYSSFRMPQFVEREITPFSYEHDNVNLILFSDGVLSLATALRLREMHKDVILFHIEEEDQEVENRCQEISEMLKLPLYIELSEIKDDLYKGMAMANKALTFAVNNGHSPRIYAGFFEMASVQNNQRRDWKYCREYIGTYEKVAKKYIPEMAILNIIPSYSVAEDELVRYKKFQRFFQQPSDVG